MNESSFLYRPQHLGWIKRLPWVIPILMIPAGFFIYFTETHNPVQLAAIVAFAIGLPLLLRALLHFSEKQMSQNASLEITSKGGVAVDPARRDKAVSAQSSKVHSGRRGRGGDSACDRGEKWNKNHTPLARILSSKASG